MARAKSKFIVRSSVEVLVRSALVHPKQLIKLIPSRVQSSLIELRLNSWLRTSNTILCFHFKTRFPLPRPRDSLRRLHCLSIESTRTVDSDGVTEMPDVRHGFRGDVAFVRRRNERTVKAVSRAYSREHLPFLLFPWLNPPIAPAS